MDEYKKIYEVYKLVNEAGFSFGDQQERKPLRAKIAKPDYKNSTAIDTESLPGGPRQVNIAAGIGGSDMGGFGEANEEIDVKGYGKMSRKSLHSMYDKVMKQVHELRSKKQFSMLPDKLELLRTLSKHL